MTAWVSGDAPARAPATKPSGFSFWRLLRWGILAALIVVVVLMFQKPAPPAAAPRTPEATAADAATFRAKLDALQQAHTQGERGQEARFSADEVNGYIHESVAEAAGAVSAAVGAQATPVPGLPAATDELAAGAAAKAPSVALAGDEITVQLLVERFGHEFTFSLSGRLAAEEGYATFHPTRCRLGVLTVPLGLVDDLIQKKLAEPETREKLKLPDFISAIRIENGQLVVIEK